MKLGMCPLGAGALLWLVATACGDSGSGTANSSGSAASGMGSGGNGTGAGTMGSAGSGKVGSGGTNSDSCPVIEPALGSSCSEEGMGCAFSNCAPPSYRDDHTLTCSQGAWALTDEVECQAPNCPATAPVIGSSCQAQSTPGPCPVGNACDTTYAYCSAGEWSLQEDDQKDAAPTGAGGGSSLIALICPESAPMPGSACCPSWYPSYCAYDIGIGSGFAPAPPRPGVTTAGSGGTTGGASGSTSASDAGATGATGADLPSCVTCDPSSMQWEASTGCN
jgi:hypothetical protein